MIHVAEIRYKGTIPGTRNVARPALFAAALLSLRPDIDDALVAEALRRGIPVTPAAQTQRAMPPGPRTDRVALLRRRTDAVITRIGRDGEAEPDGGGPAQVAR